MAFTWLAKTAVHKELALVSKTPLNRPIAAYMSACALATVWGIGFTHVRPLAGLFYLLKYLEYFFVYYIAVNNIRTRPQAQRLVIIALATAAIVSIVGTAQIPRGERVSAPVEVESGAPNTLRVYPVLVSGIRARTSAPTR